MHCRIFGALEVDGVSGPVDLGGRKRRALVAYLLIHHDRPRALDRIVDDLWEGAPSRGAAATVQTYISQLRKTLAPLRITKHTTGYAVDLGAEDVLDVERFEQLAHGVYSEVSAASLIDLAREALSLWRDAPLTEFLGAAWADEVAGQLAATRSRIVDRLADALVDSGQFDDAVAVLDDALAAAPLDERCWALLVVAHARNGRQAEALRAVGRARQLLATELGIDPGPELRTLEQQLLDGDPNLAPRVAAPATADTAPVTTSGNSTATSTGLVTFVMTDIVESTTLWDLQPSAMSTAVAAHERLIESAVTAAGGRMIKERGEGDSTLSIFELASGAVEAAIAIVQAIVTAQWPVEPALRIRVSVHTGEAELRGGDYFGSALSRAARLRAIAGANEVVCSLATAELVADAVPAGVRLVNRGSQTLRGLRRPEVVYALVQGGGDDAVARRALTVLGAITVGGATIESPQLRKLLARLLVHRNRFVPVEQLTEALWSDGAPPSARNSLQSKISRLRALVGGEALLGEPGGYRLVTEGDVVDADRFESLCRLADATTDVSDAIDAFDEALGLWHGPAYGEFSAESFAYADAARLDAERRSAEDRRLELIAQRSPDEVIAESGKLLARDPFRESAWIIKLRSLADVGRRVEALRAFHEYRTRLAVETGLSPSPQLIDLERNLLEPDALASEAADATAPPRPLPPPGEHADVAGMPWTGSVRANRPLAGRERELGLLDDALGATAQGSPRLLMITGEAGIGKTRLLDEVIARAARHGFETVRGTALTSGQAPLTALRGAILEVAPDLAAEILAGSETVMDAETADIVWSARALQFAEAVVQRARRGPLLVAIDDVQSIDAVGVTALELIHASIADSAEPNLPLLVVVTHRSIGAPENTLARIDRLARSSRASEIRLTGLDEPGLGRLVTDATSVRPTPQLIDALADGSGNPLISLAILQTFADAHALVIRAARLDVVASAPAHVPFDVREVLASLVRDLDGETRAACVRLALLGDAQRLETVRCATGWNEDHLFDVLSRAERAGLVKVDVDHVMFTHDLLRWSLVQSVPGSSRRRMHRELAETLAPHVDASDGRLVLLLADQLRQSGDRSAATRVGYWSEIAGDHCLTLALWPEAIRNYDAAADAGDTDPGRRPALQVKAGIAAFHHHDVPRSRARLLPAIDSLEDAGRLEEMGTAALVLYRTVLTLSEDEQQRAEARVKLERFLELTATDDSLARLRARVLVQLAEATWGTRASSEREPLIALARRAAEPFTDDEMTSRVEMAVALSALTDLDVDRAVRHFERAAVCASAVPDPLYESSAIGRVCMTEIISGAIGRARVALGALRERQHAMRFWSELALTESLGAAVRLYHDDALGAAESARDALRYYERSGYHFVAGIVFPTIAATQLALNDAGRALEAIESWRTVAPGGQWLFDTAVFALSGDEREARARVRARPLRVLPVAAIDYFSLASVAAAARIALALSLHDELTQFLPVLDALVERGTRATVSWPTFLPQLAADIARALDEPDAEARSIFAADAFASLREG